MIRFLSTPSARRATQVVCCFCRCCVISIHALREEGDLEQSQRSMESCNFYPRPPREGRPEERWQAHSQAIFLSTPSARRATIRRASIDPDIAISIHALREEGDVWFLRETPKERYFYPRPPRGGRRAYKLLRQAAKYISIHALREEGDSKNRDKISIFKQIIQHSARI